MVGEIDVFVNSNGRDLYRKFRLKFITNREKIKKDFGKGGTGGKGKNKGKSKDSKGIYINPPPRPASYV